jgi:hypothetical protein
VYQAGGESTNDIEALKNDGFVFGKEHLPMAEPPSIAILTQVKRSK